MSLAKQMQESFDRHAEFEKLCNILRNKDLERIAKDAEVAVSTLYNWVNFKTMNPHINTIAKVATVLGYKFKLVRSK